jgi:hypothetical protein
MIAESKQYKLDGLLTPTLSASMITEPAHALRYCGSVGKYGVLAECQTHS